MIGVGLFGCACLIPVLAILAWIMAAAIYAAMGTLFALFCWGGWRSRFTVLAALAFLAGVPYFIG